MNILQEHSEANPQYPFLRVYREKEALLMGVNLSNRYILDLYKYIEKKSTTTNAGRGALFSLQKVHLEHLKATEEDILVFIERLIEDKLVAQIVGIHYDLDLNHIQIIPFFASHPHPDKGGSIEGLFERTLANSVNAVKKWLANRLDYQRSFFQEYFARQYSEVAKVKYDFQEPVIDFHSLFYSFQYSISPANALLDYIIREISGELARKNLITRLPNNKYLVIKPEEVIPLYEEARDFLIKKVLPNAKSNTKLAYKIDRVNFDEMNYNLDEVEKPETVRFVVKKAREIKAAFNADDRANREYPGSLAIDIILGLDNLVEKQFSERWKDRTHKLKIEFKKELNDVTKGLKFLHRAIPQTQVSEFPRDVWSGLLVDRDILYTKWETEEMTYHFFIGKEYPVIKKLVGKMLDLPVKEYWKVLALREIVEKNNMFFRTLLNDEFFLNDYGSLLRKVYINLMPWYYKGLFIIPIPAFQNIFFAKAKEFLIQQQELFAKANQERFKQFTQKKEEERKQKLSSEKDSMLFHSIVEKLDYFYFTEKTIPHIGAIQGLFSEVDNKDFMQFLVDKKFRFVPLGSKHGKEMDIILYSVDKDWSEKKTGIMNFCRQQIEKLSSNFLNEADKLLLLKARKLKSFLEKSSTNPEIRLVEKKDDPYQKLEKEIKNLKAKEKEEEKTKQDKQEQESSS